MVCEFIIVVSISRQDTSVSKGMLGCKGPAERLGKEHNSRKGTTEKAWPGNMFIQLTQQADHVVHSRVATNMGLTMLGPKELPRKQGFHQP